MRGYCVCLLTKFVSMLAKSAKDRGKEVCFWTPLARKEFVSELFVHEYYVLGLIFSVCRRNIEYRERGGYT